MGYYRSAQLFYGVHIPREKFQTLWLSREMAWLEGVIKSTPGLNGDIVGVMAAGDYDHNELFLCADSGEGHDYEIPLGSFRVINSHTQARDLPLWDRQLRLLYEAAGYGTDMPEPGWIVVPDLS